MAAAPSPASQLTCERPLQLRPWPQACLKRFLPLFPRCDRGLLAEVPIDTRLWPERPPPVTPRTRVRLAPDPTHGDAERNSHPAPQREVTSDVPPNGACQ